MNYIKKQHDRDCVFPFSSRALRISVVNPFWCYLVLFGALWRSLVLKLFFMFEILLSMFKRFPKIREEPILSECEGRAGAGGIATNNPPWGHFLKVQ